MPHENTVMLEIEAPRQVVNQMRKLIEHGWYVDEADVVSEALRRFLVTHQADVLEQQICEDVAWACPVETLRHDHLRGKLDGLMTPVEGRIDP